MDRIQLKTLVGRKFGRTDYNFHITFKPHRQFLCDRDEMFEAMHSLLDPKFAKSEVTKPRYEGNDSFAQLNFERNGKQQSIKRIFGVNQEFYINDRKERQHDLYFEKISPLTLLIHEPYYTSPEDVSDHILKGMCGLRTIRQQECQTRIIQCEYIKIHGNTFFRSEERDEYETKIKMDIDKYKTIEGQKLGLLVNTYNDSGTANQQITEIPNEKLFEDQRATSKICYLLPLAEQILNAHCDVCKSAIHSTKKESDISSDNDVVDEFLNSSRYKIVPKIREIKKMTESAESASHAYSANPDLFLFYRQRFTAEEWITHRAIIEQKKIEDTAFMANMEASITEQSRAAERIDENVNTSIRKSRQLMRDLGTSERRMNGLLCDVLRGLGDFYIEKLIEFAKIYLPPLTDAKNDPHIGIVSFQNYFAGLFHCVYEYANTFMNMPAFLFENVECEDNNLGTSLENFMVPLSKIIYFDKACTAIDFLERLHIDMDPANDTEKTFVFAAYDQIRGILPEEEIATALREPAGFKCNPILDNLLSNLQISNEDRKEKVNLFNYRKKKIHLKGSQIVDISKPTNFFFTKLRSIKNIYTKISEHINECDKRFDEICSTLEQLYAEANNCCNIEEKLHSELLTLQLLNYEKLSTNLSLSKYNLLLAKSKNRSKMFDGLLQLTPRGAETGSVFPQSFSQYKQIVSVIDLSRDNTNDCPEYEQITTVLKEYFSQRKNQRTSFQQSLNNELSKSMVRLEMYRSNINSNQDPTNQQLTVADINFLDAGRHYFTIQCYNKIPASYKRMTVEDRTRSFDRIISALNFPMQRVQLLYKHLTIIWKAKQLERAFNNILPRIRNNVLQPGDSITYQIDKMFARIEKYLTEFRKTPYKIECNWGSDLRQTITVYALNEGRDTYLFDDHAIIGIIFFIFYMDELKCQPIILKDIFQGCSTNAIIEVYYAILAFFRITMLVHIDDEKLNLLNDYIEAIEPTTE